MKLSAALVAVVSALFLTKPQDHQDIPKPQKEHGLLRQFEGQWECTSTNLLQAEKSEMGKGTESARMDFGGYWLVMDYKGDHLGKPYNGHGAMGYDPRKAKYVMCWIDNMAPFGMFAEGEADSSGRVFTFVSDGCDPETGKPAKVRTVFEVKNPDNWTLSFYFPGKDGPERKGVEMRYTRSK